MLNFDLQETRTHKRFFFLFIHWTPCVTTMQAGHSIFLCCFLSPACVDLSLYYCAVWNMSQVMDTSWESRKKERRRWTGCCATSAVFKAAKEGRGKYFISRSVMYRAAGYITARSSFKTSWVPAKKVSEQYLQPYGWGNACGSAGTGLSDNI